MEFTKDIQRQIQSHPCPDPELSGDRRITKRYPGALRSGIAFFKQQSITAARFCAVRQFLFYDLLTVTVYAPPVSSPI